MAQSRKFYYGWIILVICFFTLLAGYVCRNTFAVFYPAIVGEFGWTRGNTALIFSINVLVYGAVAPFAGGLADRFRPRYVLAAGAVLTGIGMSLCSLAFMKWQFYLLYGVVAAIGLSVAGWVPVATILTNWFVKRRALVFGVLGAGFGLSLVAAYMAQYVILAFGWRSAYLIIGLTVGILIPPICVLFLRRTPAEKGLFPDGITAAEAEIQPAHAVDGAVGTYHRSGEWTLGKALRSRRFWLLFVVWVLTMGLAEQTVISQQVYFYLDAGYAPMVAAVFYGTFGVSLAVGNLLGSLSDRTGRGLFYFPCWAACAACVAVLLRMDDTSEAWVPWVFATGYGVSFGALSCVLNATVADIFNGRQYGRIAGMMTFGFALGGSASPWLAGYLYDVTGSHTSTYAVLIAALLISVIMFQFVAPLKLKRARHHQHV